MIPQVLNRKDAAVLRNMRQRPWSRKATGGIRVLGLAARSLDNLLPDPDPGPLVDCVCLFVLTLAGTAPLAWLAYRYVEQPGIQLGRRWISHLRTRRDNAQPLHPAGWPAASTEGQA